MIPADPRRTWARAVETLGAAGYHLPPEPPPPGGSYRIPAAGKGERNRSAWVKLTAAGDAVHVVDHASGFSDTVQGERAAVVDVAELRRLRREADEQRRRDELEQRERYAAGTAAARRAWTAATPSEAHPYPVCKGVTLPGCRVAGAELLVPLTGVDGGLVSLQRIRPDGTKRCWTGAPITGAAYRIGDALDGATVLVCEGAATGATLHEASGHATVCAMFAGNLEAVARAVRARLPRARLILCGDDDRRAARNVGRVKAVAAARAVGASVTFPTFCKSCASCSDFNDVAACERRRRPA